MSTRSSRSNLAAEFVVGADEASASGSEYFESQDESMQNYDDPMMIKAEDSPNILEPQTDGNVS